MPTYPLSTTVATGDPNHAALHNGEREDINDLWGRLGRDTGWRNISTGSPGDTNLLTNGWVAPAGGGIEIRRVGMLVHCRFTLDETGSTANAVLTGWPTGFTYAGMAMGSSAFDALNLTTPPIPAQAQISGLSVFRPATGRTAARRGGLAYFTDATWPATLPGVAA